MSNISPLATQIPTTKRRWRRIKPGGLCVHTTGSGIVRRAKEQQRDVRELCIEWYRPRASVHYFIDYGGRIVQFMPDNWRGAHVGVSRKERRKYLSGQWEKDFRTEDVRRWHARWQGYKSPQHIYPTRSPNSFYVGVELPLLLEPIDGLWFTIPQHLSAAKLWRCLQRRHTWSNRDNTLTGHEDLDAYGRWNKGGGGWDPGALRDEPRFDWELVRTATAWF